MWAVLVAWLNGVAAVVGPVSIIIGLPGAAVGSIVGVVKVRRWAINTLVPAQEATQAAADRAATAATAAEDASREASKHAKSAGATALELKETNGRLIGWLPERTQETDYLRETNNRLVAQLVIQASKHPEDFDSPTAPRPVAPTSTSDDIWTTGRHRLPPSGSVAADRDGIDRTFS